MGNCVCAEASERRDGHVVEDHTQGRIIDTYLPRSISHVSTQTTTEFQAEQAYQSRTKRQDVELLVLETLGLIRSLVDNDQEPPPAMLHLHRIAERESGWLAVVKSLIKVIPMNDPLGPAVIILLLDDCPLPTKESISRLTVNLRLGARASMDAQKNPERHRNICVVLGCLAEKLAGPLSVHLLTRDVLDYLFGNLNTNCQKTVVLHSIVAMEKFAQTSENKVLISRELEKSSVHPLLVLECWCIEDDDLSKREVGFCARWCMDNLFLHDSRRLSYEVLDRTDLNVILNDDDVSEYLKLSPDGLEARCDASSFESVRCTFQVDRGVWYYEVRVMTSGVMQIGWATKNSKFLNHEGYGIGDDGYSIAYDGCRQLLWHNARSESHSHHCWKPGDIVGLLLNLDQQEIVFSLNGNNLPPDSKVFQNAKSGYFAAASFMSFQQCQFNFGRSPFLFPPTIAFKTFNQFGSLSDERAAILPRHEKLRRLRATSIDEGACSLCFDQPADVILSPCNHGGFCMTCSLQLDICPFCRRTITGRLRTEERRDSSASIKQTGAASERGARKDSTRSRKDSTRSRTDSTRSRTDSTRSGLRRVRQISTGSSRSSLPVTPEKGAHRSSSRP